MKQEETAKEILELADLMAAMFNWEKDKCVKMIIRVIS